MPSIALLNWQQERTLRLIALETQCAATLTMTSPSLALGEENIRGYCMSLSAHFQGYCRDLYTESAQYVVSKVRPSLKILIQTQFTTQCTLDHGNPNLHNLKRDFGRLGVSLNLVADDPAHASRLQHLASMNEWRNIAAHHGRVPSSGPPGFNEIRTWRLSCNELATALDQIVYNRMLQLTRRKPWSP